MGTVLKPTLVNLLFFLSKTKMTIEEATAHVGPTSEVIAHAQAAIAANALVPEIVASAKQKFEDAKNKEAGGLTTERVSIGSPAPGATLAPETTSALGISSDALNASVLAPGTPSDALNPSVSAPETSSSMSSANAPSAPAPSGETGTLSVPGTEPWTTVQGKGKGPGKGKGASADTVMKTPFCKVQWNETETKCTNADCSRKHLPWCKKDACKPVSQPSCVDFWHPRLNVQKWKQKAQGNASGGMLCPGTPHVNNKGPLNKGKRKSYVTTQLEEGKKMREERTRMKAQIAGYKNESLRLKQDKMMQQQVQSHLTQLGYPPLPPPTPKSMSWAQAVTPPMIVPMAAQLPVPPQAVPTPQQAVPKATPNVVLLLEQFTQQIKQQLAELAASL